MKKILLFAFLMVSFTLATTAQKMTADEVIKKHLDSIGKAEDRAKIQNIVVRGNALFSQGASEGVPAQGSVVLASEGNKLLMGMSFPIPIYPFEKITYDADKVRVGFVRPSVRTAFGEYVTRNEEIVKEGLLGGILSNSWALHTLATRKAKVSFDGKKKIEGKEVYALSYELKKGSNAQIRMFFDVNNFQHLRTEYRRTQSAQMGATPNLSASQVETRESLVEDFADFKAENGLSLPHTYKISLILESRKTLEHRYTFDFKEFYFNQKLEANSWNLDAN
jgi:hypothetical protein